MQVEYLQQEACGLGDLMGNPSTLSEQLDFLLSWNYCCIISRNYLDTYLCSNLSNSVISRYRWRALSKLSHFKMLQRNSRLVSNPTFTLWLTQLMSPPLLTACGQYSRLWLHRNHPQLHCFQHVKKVEYFLSSLFKTLQCFNELSWWLFALYHWHKASGCGRGALRVPAEVWHLCHLDTGASCRRWMIRLAEDAHNVK